MIDLKSILKVFGLFIVIFIGLFAFASLESVEERLGARFVKSTSNFLEWTMPQASINVEHDRDPLRYDPNEVWISPVGKEWLEKKKNEARLKGTSLTLDNEASLLFKVGTFPKTVLIFLLALILSTPMLLRKKVKALLISLFIFMGYFYLFIYFVVMHHIAINKIGIYELDGFSMTFVRFIEKTFCNFGFSLTFAIIIWLLTSINFNALFDQFNLALEGKTATAKAKATNRGKKIKKKKSK